MKKAKKVTIVTNKKSQKLEERLQKETDRMVKDNMLPDAIMMYIAERYKIPVSMHFKNEEVILTCHLYS